MINSTMVVTASDSWQHILVVQSAEFITFKLQVYVLEEKQLNVYFATVLCVDKHRSLFYNSVLYSVYYMEEKT